MAYSGPRRALISSVPSWVLRGASTDLYFKQGTYFVAGHTTGVQNVISCTRASTGYAQMASGLFVPFSANTPRITSLGLLVEEARTNGIRNNSNTGVVSGSPGTLPTNWTIGSIGTLTQTIVGTGTDDGIPYMDIRFNGTTSNTQFSLFPESTTQIAATSGQTWTASLFIKVVSGSLTNISSIYLSQIERTSGGSTVTLSDQTITVPTSGAFGLARSSYTRTNSGGGTVAVIQPRIALNFSSGVAIDVTLRIGGFQEELGAFVTSPILTTSAAVTRAADVIALTGSASTAILNAQAAYFETYGVVYTSGNRFVDFNNVAKTMNYASNTSALVYNGTTTASATFGTGTIAGVVKSAFGFDASSITAIVNNGSKATTASAWGTPSGPIYLGSNNGSNTLSGYMRRATFGPTKGMFDGLTA